MVVVLLVSPKHNKKTGSLKQKDPFTPVELACTVAFLKKRAL